MQQYNLFLWAKSSNLLAHIPTNWFYSKPSLHYSFPSILRITTRGASLTRRLGVLGARDTTIRGILTGLGLRHEGRLHSGADDARNIARAVIKLTRMQAKIRVRSATGEDPHTPWLATATTRT